MALTLYDLTDKHGRRYSPYGWRVRMALAHKGLDAAVELCWHGDAEKLGFSGQALVPVLVDDGRAIHDSWSIACYLDEAYPDRPMLMEGPQARATTRFLNHWMDGQVGRPLVRPLYLDIWKSLHPKVDAVAFRKKREDRAGRTLEALYHDRASDFAEVNRLIAPLENLLTHQPFVAGAAPAYADYIVFGTLQMSRCLNGVQILSDQPAIFAWQARMDQLFQGLGRSDVLS